MKTLTSSKTIVVGMSGGVDSAVCALLLKQMGHNVIGMFMKNWDETVDGVCTSQQDFEDVVSVSKQIGIPFYPITFAKEYKEEVFSHFLEELKKGNTPNPDILCNKEIKFKLLLDSAKKLGANFLATGHYAKKNVTNGRYLLERPCDLSKDQTYFLYTLNQAILSEVLFPLQDIAKSEVRKIAKEHKLTVSEKRDSTGICFIGKRNFRKFLSDYIQYSPGEFRLIDGPAVGTHVGVSYYTIGQRKGLGIGGPGEAYFVVDKNVEKNIVYVAQGANHPALFADALTACTLSWVQGFAPEFLPLTCTAKIRYRQPDTPCVIEKIEEGRAYVRFLEPQRAITRQQAIVFYQGSVCLGGGFIDSKSPSYFHLKKALV